MVANRANTALLVLDYQELIVNNWAPHGADLINRMGHAIEYARSSGVPVFYGVIEFRPGHPEVPKQNKMLAGLREGGLLVAGAPGSGLHPGIKRNSDEPIVVRKRVNPFHGTELDMLLHAKGVDKLVVGGISTSGVVLSTVRGGGDLDYDLVVLSDCCDDPEDDVHQMLLGNLFPRQALVQTSDEWIRS